MMKRVALFSILAMVGMATSASALVITGSGTSLPGGGSCSASGVTTAGTGATFTCTGIVLSGHTKVYLGIRNTVSPNGNNMLNADPAASSAAVFRNSSTAASSITYTSTTSVNQQVPSVATLPVTNTLNLTRTAGSGTVVATGGSPANSPANGDIGFLFQITAAGTFTLDVDVLAQDSSYGLGQACPAVYDPSHVNVAGGDHSRVDLQFYWSDCGDGQIDSPEVCDDGANNGTASSCCTTSCTFQPALTACSFGNGASECSGADTCSGTANTCLNNDVSAGTPCTDTSAPGTNDPNQCKDAQCNGSGACNQTQGNEANGTACADGNYCTTGDTCQSGTCTAGGGDPCPGADGDADCSESCVDTGFETGNCLGNDPNGSPCAGNGTSECSNADTCDGAGTCLDNDLAAGTPCTDGSPPSTGDCKDAQCDGGGSCDQTFANETDGTPCAEGDYCSAGDTCQTGTCTAGSGSPCPGPDGDTDCSESCVDTGYETGNCLGADPDGTPCRPAVGTCDLAETCSSGTCPADSVKPVNTVCNAGSGDSCDPDEVCDGVGTTCPPDVVSPSGTVCNMGSGDSCDPDETCSGTPGQPCPSDTITPSGTVCRTGSGDVCDPDETCTGTADQPCPADVVQPASFVCNPGSGDVCDPDSFCPGVAAGTCAADVVAPMGTVCNPGSGDMCDPDETCSGNPDEACPNDSFASSSTPCRPAADVCDAVENCPGVANQACPVDAKEPNTTPCRPSTDACDAVENCTGSSNTCPADLAEPDGTSCSDGLFCNGGETCSSGTCQAGTPPCAFVCSEGTDMCLTTACPNTPQSGCRTSAKKLLLVKNKMDSSKDKLIWKFIKGDQTSQTDFGDPTMTAAYGLCIYGGTSGALVATASVPPSNSLWAPIGTKGYKYKDQAGSQSGIQKIILKGGDNGKTKALVKGKGTLLPDPLDLGPLGTNVTAQLLNHETGICWQTTFTAPKKDDTTLYKSKQ